MTSILTAPRPAPAPSGPSTRLTVAIGDHDLLLREGLARILTAWGLDVVARCGDAGDLVRRTLTHCPDVVVLDVQLSARGGDDAGLRAAVEIRRRRPRTGVLILSARLHPAYARELIGDRPEGVGYLLKQRVDDVGSFVDAVTRVAAGGSALDAQVVGRMLGRPGDGALGVLTAREHDVLEAMAQGRSNAGIARALLISEAAVEKHATALFRKLRVDTASTEHRRVHAVLRYMEERYGLAESPRPEPLHTASPR